MGSAMTMRMVARIQHDGDSVVQSGHARAKQWVLTLLPASPNEVEPLMGWTASDDPPQQVTVTFPDKDSAIAFAERRGWAYTVSEPRHRPIRPKSYASNFLGDTPDA